MSKSAELIVQIAASVIAIAAIVVSVWEGIEQRHHNRLSVRPVLNFETDIAANGTLLGIDLKNVGFGPAMVKQFTISIDDRPVQEKEGDVWMSAEKILNLSDPNLPIIEYNYDVGDVIPPNEDQHIIALKEREAYKQLSERDKELWRQAMRRIKIEVDYTSIYEEEYKAQYPR